MDKYVWSFENIFVSDLWLLLLICGSQKKSYETESIFCAAKFVIRILQGSQSSSWNLFAVLVAVFWGFFVSF